MRTRMISIIVVIGLLLCLSSMLQAQEDSTLFREAKTLMYQHDYEQASNLFQLLKVKFPNSRYEDDVEFWSAYILEQQGKNNDAFITYQGLINKYPGSPWVDDAQVHQIGLAEKFVKEGQQHYKDFLTEKLTSSYTNVKYQASLSLGKLGDERAIPALKEMENNGDRDMSIMAKSLLQNFQVQSDIKQKEPARMRKPDAPPRDERETDAPSLVPSKPGLTNKVASPKQNNIQIEKQRSVNPQDSKSGTPRPAPKPQPQKSGRNKKNDFN